MNTKGYHFILSEELMSKVAELAKEDRRSTTKFIEILLEEKVKSAEAHKKGDV